MNYCSKCGTKNEENMNFCTNCGNALNSNNAQNIPVYQNNQAYYVKPKNGKATASMVLGIIAAVWALLSLISLGSVEEALREGIIENGIIYDSYSSYKMGFAFGYCGINFICGIIGLILGLVAKKNGKAIAGIITSAFGILIAIISCIVIMGIEL